MSADANLMCGFLLVLMMYNPSYSLCVDCINIGVIADVRSPAPETVFFQCFDYNVTYIWLSVDTEELFHVYKSVLRLDDDPTIDVIILADVSDVTLKFPQLLHTRRTPIIHWGSKRTTDLQTQAGQVCRGENISAVTEDTTDLYCAIREHLYHRNLTIDYSYADIIPQSLAKILMQLLHWKHVTIIYDTESEHEVSAIIDQLSSEQVMMMVINIDQETKLEQKIFKIYEEKAKFAEPLPILVVCRYKCARKVVHMANHFDDLMSDMKKKTLLKQFSTWLIVLYGYRNFMSTGLRACADDLDNVAIVAIPDWIGSTTQTLTSSLKMTIKETMKELYLNTTNWKNVFIDKLFQTAAELHPSVHCRGFNVDTLLWAASKQRTFSNVGYIDMSGQIMVANDIFPNIKYGYNKRQFLASTLEYSPFVMSNISANGTTQYFGFCLDLLEELALSLNFTYVLTKPADRSWGTYIDREKETFNGLVGQLQRMEVDIVAAPLTIQADRSRVMDFAYPFFYEVSTILMKRLDPMSRKWRTLIDPFQWEVHVAIGISLITVTLFLWLLERWNWFYRTEENAEIRRQNGGLHYWHNSFWYMYGALLCQGGIHLPDSVAGRTFVSCWWLFCIIVVGTYCGNLIAFLTFTKVKPPFTNLQELVDRKGEYKWGIIGGSSWENAFVYTSKVPLYKSVGRGLVEFNKSDPSVLDGDPSVHVQKVLQGSYAWIGDRTSMDFHMATECDLATSNDEFFPMSYGFGFQKNSPHGVLFAEQLLKIHESGLLKIWKRKWWPRATFCKNDRIVTDSQPVTLADVQSAYYVCIIGIGLGLLAFMGELAVHKYRASRQGRNPLARQTSVVSLSHAMPS